MSYDKVLDVDRLSPADRITMVKDGKIPKPRAGGRMFNTNYPLGKIMEFRGYNGMQVQFATGINARTLTRYLANERRITPKHAALLAELLEVDVEHLYPKDQPVPLINPKFV